MPKARSNEVAESLEIDVKLRLYTAFGLRKTSLLHKQINNHATLAYKNSVRKCYQDVFFLTNMQFNNPTSMPQT